MLVDGGSVRAADSCPSLWNASALFYTVESPGDIGCKVVLDAELVENVMGWRPRGLGREFSRGSIYLLRWSYSLSSVSSLWASARQSFQ